jgi:PAT family beta-lactamase induction signal transducer AmpG
MFIYLRPQILAIIILGFASGLPLSLTASTLTAMLTDYGINVKTIGLFALVALPYAYKYLWSPLVDNIHIPFLGKMLGRRKSWLFVIQILLTIVIAACGVVNPNKYIELFALLCFLLAFLSATQDIIIDALRIEMIETEEQGAGATAVIIGYRIGMLASGAGALYLSHFFGWTVTYIVISILLIPGIIVGQLCREPKIIPVKIPGTFKDFMKKSYFEPFQEFAKRQGWVAVLVFIIFYKMSDAYVGTLTNNFLKAMGFNNVEIANIVKIYGLFATLAGSLAAGYLLEKIGMYNTLLLGYVLQILSNLAYLPVWYYGHDYMVLVGAMSIENFASGLSNVAFIAFISSVCNLRFTATHYAFLSSLAAFARTNVAATGGFVVDAVGWPYFFFFSCTLSIPAIFFLSAAMNSKTHQVDGKLTLATV